MQPPGDQDDTLSEITPLGKRSQFLLTPSATVLSPPSPFIMGAKTR
ncbi:hypothetical protein THTE_0882 [Thermogutta terrifontis]|uniref:Uncharacterized protein n=1 Tax=Thermogutta terrifontis TaxID=1331910 RepID=A0A286RBZ6_9BACT|nr:hypothetical protein THTE_0882 [Thermogutta terrifontis]